MEASMSKETWTTILLCLVLGSVGSFAWWLQLRPPLQADVTALAGLPDQIAQWSSSDVSLDAAVESELRADLNLQRVYYEPTGEMLWLYIGYYGTAAGGRPEHTPRGCYVGANWGIESSRVLEPAPHPPLRLNEYLVTRADERRLVHFWYRSHRSTGLLGGLDQNLDRLIGRLVDGRSDGALIRISTPLRGDDVVGARSRLLSFASSLDPLLADRWPAEHEVSRGS